MAWSTAEDVEAHALEQARDYLARHEPDTHDINAAMLDAGYWALDFETLPTEKMVLDIYRKMRALDPACQSKGA